ncbi:hypothetical protein [Nitrosomonas communis]|uniref:hypothetical protein n=1 Tax=Nitrosomonas communis TaxID=44574 RepID=UPI0026F1FB79|nr:hypothetical protein [Nitrosomonas communis]MCO6428961.1 hypothetical protein [Nitrosomonas communis]
MKNLFLPLSFAIIGSLLSLSSHADPMVVVKRHAIFLAANNSLTVMPDPPHPLSCTYDAANDIFIPGTSASIQIPLPGALDVKVAGNDLYVATSTLVNDVPATGYVKYDVSACLPDAPFTPSIARADLAAGELVIPCVVVDGKEYNVVMNQRGRSMNWEVIFADSGCH